MNDPEFDDVKPSLSKEDWKKKYVERIRSLSSYKKTKPSLPNSTKPELWKKYRIDLSEYLEHSMYLEPICSKLSLIDILISENPGNDDEAIINEYAKQWRIVKIYPISSFLGK
ncbi:7925_t:CDS:1 [Racocetra fulgida]|uniref:7925_t:CDS:1 n=1 Tax=Racocetra fulgida TaxID=60492 RepID=A0A9N9C851_9GLOM|nr:7925_t:CDS:1 [Racocetra fulgida]